MTVNYLMVSSAGGQLPLVMTVNYLMASSDDGHYLMDSSDRWFHGFLVMTVNYLMASSDDGQLPHGF